MTDFVPRYSSHMLLFDTIFLRRNDVAIMYWGGDGFNEESALAINFYAPNLSMSHKNSLKYPRIGGGARS